MDKKLQRMGMDVRTTVRAGFVCSVGNSEDCKQACANDLLKTDNYSGYQTCLSNCPKTDGLSC